MAIARRVPTTAVTSDSTTPPLRAREALGEVGFVAQLTGVLRQIGLTGHLCLVGHVCLVGEVGRTNEPRSRSKFGNNHPRVRAICSPNFGLSHHPQSCR